MPSIRLGFCRALFILIGTVVTLSTIPAVAQEGKVIENPSVPAAKNAGRILQLKEIWRITDESGEFYFKHPNGLEIAPDGPLFLKDEKQLLRFGPDGRFQKNLYKNGQGPGEISNNFNYCMDGDLLLVKDWGNRRFFRIDAEGVFHSQLDKAIGRAAPLGARADSYIVQDTEWPPDKEQTSRLRPILEHISLVSRDGENKKRIHTFQPRWFLTPSMGTQWDPNLKAISEDGRFLIGCHSTDYLVEILDFDTGRIALSFRRSYRRIKHVLTENERKLERENKIPAAEFEWDIQDLFANNKEIWIKTSTSDPAKGDLYDVFDYDGRFLDSFYLGPGRSLMKVLGNDLYSLEKDVKENFFIVKYRLN